MIIKYSDPEYKSKKEELEKLGWKVCAWFNEGLGFSPPASDKNATLFDDEITRNWQNNKST